MSEIEIYATNQDAGFAPLRERLEQILRDALNRLQEIAPFADEPPARMKLALIASFVNILAEMTVMMGEDADDLDLVTGTNADEVVRKFREAVQASLLEELSAKSGTPEPQDPRRH